MLQLLPAAPRRGPTDAEKLALLREAAQLRLEHDARRRRRARRPRGAFPLAPRDARLDREPCSALRAATGNHAALAAAYERATEALGGDPREAARLRMAYAGILVRELGSATRPPHAYRGSRQSSPAPERAARRSRTSARELGRWDEAADVVVRLRRRARGVRRRARSATLEAAGEEARRPRRARSRRPRARARSRQAARRRSPAAAHHRLALLPPRPARRPRRGQARVAAPRARARRRAPRRWLVDLVAMELREGHPRALLRHPARLADGDPAATSTRRAAAEVASEPRRCASRRRRSCPPCSGRATAAWRGTAQSARRRSLDAVAEVGNRRARRSPPATGGRARRRRRPAGRGRPPAVRPADPPRLRCAPPSIATRVGDVDPRQSTCTAPCSPWPRPTTSTSIERLAHLLEAEDRVPELLDPAPVQLGSRPRSRAQARAAPRDRPPGRRRRAARRPARRARGQPRPTGPATTRRSTRSRRSSTRQGPAPPARRPARGAGRQRLEAAANARPRRQAVGRGSPRSPSSDTEEIERAIAGHRRVVALAPASDSLARSRASTSSAASPPQAVPWLESLLGTRAGASACSVVLAARQGPPGRRPGRPRDRRDRDQPRRRGPALELRMLLADLYREAELWEPLARHLTRSLPLLGDDDQARGEFAREAAAIYVDQLDSPASAIPALEKALALDPDGQGSLRTGSRSASAPPATSPRRARCSTELIADLRPAPLAGARRRSRRARAGRPGRGQHRRGHGRDRAGVEDGRLNAAIQKELAEMARAAGTARQGRAHATAPCSWSSAASRPATTSAAVGQSEVLFELHKLAAGAARRTRPRSCSRARSTPRSSPTPRSAACAAALLAHGERRAPARGARDAARRRTPSRSQAQLLADLADALDGQLGPQRRRARRPDSGDRRDPDRARAHDRARALAQAGAIQALRRGGRGRVARLRRKDDPPAGRRPC